MKNLAVHIGVPVDIGYDIVAQCIDSDNGILYVLTAEFRILQVEKTDYNPKVKTIQFNFDTDLFGQSELGDNDINLFEFLVEFNSLLVALKNGRIVSIGLAHDASRILYHHPKTLESICLAPDQDLIALADSDNDIFTLSMDGEVISRSNSLTESESLHKPVGVGWGSKETQFFGLDGRPSKEKEMKDRIEVTEDEMLTIGMIESSSLYIEGRKLRFNSTLIDWRSDGQFIATLTYISDTDKHYLKVWGRNLKLQYMSDQLVTIERGLLSWTPDKQYVCCAQRRDHRMNEIALFEKNGMVHQRVSLPTMMPNFYICDISWSPDSKILAILGNQFSTVGNCCTSETILMLYTTQNFHYYLKFSMVIGRNERHWLRWDLIHQNQLHIVSSSGLYRQYDCNFVIESYRLSSTVAVTDANKILLTPMELCNIPPPMSAITLEVNYPIYTTTLCQSDAAILIVTLDNRLIYSFPNGADGARDGEYENIDLRVHLGNQLANDFSNRYKNYNVIKFDSAQSYQLYTLVRRLQVIALRQTATGMDIVAMKLPSEPGDEITVKTLRTFHNQRVVWNPSSCTAQDSILMMLSDGSVIAVDIETGSIKDSFRIQLPYTMLGQDLVDIRVSRHPFRPGSYNLITLGRDQNLRFNETLISNSCTSVRVTGRYLVFTTSDNLLHLGNLETCLPDENSKSSKPLSFCSQPIESGAALVMTDEMAAKVILQMPRGNLEILHPRLLVIGRLIEFLEDMKYVDALKLARRHRLNLNFIVDYFLRNTKGILHLISFVTVIAKHDSSLLNLFTSELDNSDTLTNRYKDIMQQFPDTMTSLSAPIIEDKTNRVCSAISEALKHLEHPTLQSEILCYLKMIPKETHRALHLVHLNRHSTEVRNELIKFILYFIDIEQLFQEALGTYDTDIALMVAGVSNKDPKEYLVLLDSFNKIEDERERRLAIDLHLKRYDFAVSCLTYIFGDSKEPEKRRTQLIEMMISKRMYKVVIGLLSSPLPNFTASFKADVWTKYANYLFEKRYYNEAGLALSLANQLEHDEERFNRALVSFQLAGLWDQSLALIKRSKLVATREDIEISKILDQNLARGDPVRALACLCKPASTETSVEIAHDLISRNEWFLAEFITTDDRRQEIRGAIYETVKTECLAIKSNLAEQLKKAKNDLAKLKELLVRNWEKQSNNVHSGEYVTDTLSTIDASEVSSQVSGPNAQGVPRSGGASIKTRSSSKSSKSQAAKGKRINLKEGSRHHDIALVLELKKFIASHKSMAPVLTRTYAALFEYGEHEHCRPHQQDMEKLSRDSHEFIRETVELLWPTNSLLDQTYSLYRRFSNVMSAQDQVFENVDFEILLRPDIPAGIHFEIW